MTKLSTSLAGALAVGLAVCCAVPAPPAERTAPSPRGAELYAQHCALCHGPTGAGDGEATLYLFPRPRDFTAGRFRLVSTASGAPTPDDVIRVLHRGMPGSAMPPFSWMPEADLAALAAHVRDLAVRGWTARLQRDGVPAAEAHARAERRMAATEPIDPGPPLSATEADLARGARLFGAHCATCHGLDGRGLGPIEVFTPEGDFAWARDFTAGVLKGGASDGELMWRVLAGMPGSAMVPAPLGHAEARDIVAYVQTLIRPHAEDRLVQTRQQVRARRVAVVPADADDALWSEGETTLALAPLAWREGAVLAATISAVHDGERIAIRLSWQDETRDDRPLTGAAQPDACALQLSNEPAPPLFGMGSRDHPVHIWHWKPFRSTDASAMVEMVEMVEMPHRTAPGASPARPDTALATPPASGRAVRAAGLRSVPRLGVAARPLDVAAHWHDGVWSVVFSRPLAAAEEHDLPLAPGRSTQVAAAIWNGSARTHDSDKSYTIWHELRLDP